MSLITRTGKIDSIFWDDTYPFAIIVADNKEDLFYLCGHEFKQYQGQIEQQMHIEFTTIEDDEVVLTLKPIKDRASYNSSKHIV